MHPSDWSLQAADRAARSAIKDESLITESFRTGEGVGWHEHHGDLFQGTERFFRPGYAANLVDSWLPALDGVTAKLTAGASVADVGERCRFEVARAAAYPGTNYDLVALFDCLPDMGDPVGAVKHVRQSLAPDGTWLLVEPFAGDRVEDNLNPVGRIFYNASTMICVPASLSQEVGLGLGAQAGEAALRDVATAAGFSSFRRATETPFNIVLEARP